MDENNKNDRNEMIEVIPELPDTWTITATFSVFAGDMEPEDVIAKAQEDLSNMVDGSDYMSVGVLHARRDEL